MAFKKNFFSFNFYNVMNLYFLELQYVKEILIINNQSTDSKYLKK